MSRKADEQKLKELQQFIQVAPGKKAGTIARLLHWRREKVNRGLATLNDHGVFLYEDDKGQVFPCRDDFE